MISTPLQAADATDKESLTVAEPQTRLAFKVGDRTRANESIYEGADDCHPGGYLCRKGDLLIIRNVRNDGKKWPYSVSHEGVTNSSFSVSESELEPDQASTSEEAH